MSELNLELRTVRGWLRKWSPSGEVLVTSIAEPDQMLKAKALGLLEGDVIVAGYANTFEHGRDVVVERRTGSTLSLAWSYRYNGPLNGEDEPHRVAVWRSSPIWVTGYQQTEIAAGSELSLRELHPNGQFTWQRSLANAEGRALAGESNGIAVNDIDDIYYLCGTLFDSEASPSMAAMFQIGYLGEQAWQRNYPDVNDTSTEAAALGCSLGAGALTVVGTERENGREQFWAAMFYHSPRRPSWRSPQRESKPTPPAVSQRDQFRKRPFEFRRGRRDRGGWPLQHTRPGCKWHERAWRRGPARRSSGGRGESGDVWLRWRHRAHVPALQRGNAVPRVCLQHGLHRLRLRPLRTPNSERATTLSPGL